MSGATLVVRIRFTYLFFILSKFIQLNFRDPDKLKISQEKLRKIKFRI